MEMMELRIVFLGFGFMFFFGRFGVLFRSGLLIY